MAIFARKAKDRYHHGNLRETLLDLAEQQIAQRGPAGLSLSEMARVAGVSTAAIYRHYADLNALVGAVARRGFNDFSLRLRAAAATTTEPRESFGAMGDAYIAFARERPGAYAAMFSSTVAYSDPDLARASTAAFDTLMQGLARTLASTGINSAGAYPLAVKVWALSHGVATLAQTGRLTPAAGVVPETILREGTEALIRAAIVAAPPAP
ncbi:MAG: TetR/AcrR family transcriptional regulator [Proteobacteria bacterium]|nr:TetR/AcrR family transcriptional regulator [Pseudomonadota bacterium]